MDNEKHALDARTRMLSFQKHNPNRLTDSLVNSSAIWPMHFRLGLISSMGDFKLAETWQVSKTDCF